MLYATFITVGSLPKGPFSEIALEYEKLLTKFVKLEVRVVSAKGGSAPGGDNIERAIEKLPAGTLVILLDALGKHMTSEAFAEKIGALEDEGRHVAFVLGGPFGLSDEIKKRADILLSLSPMTTTHDLARLFFLEQLYRAFTILRGAEYHK